MIREICRFAASGRQKPRLPEAIDMTSTELLYHFIAWSQRYHLTPLIVAMRYTLGIARLSPRGYGLAFDPLIVLILCAQSLALVANPVQGVARSVAEDDYHWVATWTSMPQEVEQSNLPPSPFVCPGFFLPIDREFMHLRKISADGDHFQNGGSSMFKDATLRQTLHMSVGASRIRIQFSNTFGGSDLPITGASVALPTGSKIGVNSIDTATLAGLTFKGSSSVTVPRGQVIYSDPIDFTVEPQSMLAVNMYFQAGQSSNRITGHPGSRTTSWMQQGNHVNATTVTGSSTKHWYFVSVVEAWAAKNTTALVILGDSITDGRGSDDDRNNRSVINTTLLDLCQVLNILKTIANMNSVGPTFC